MSCSVEEPTMTTAEKRAKSRRVHVGFCCKCKNEQSTILIRYAEYCDPCFLLALDSKFRTALRNARPARVLTPDNVMLAFSGGPSSRSLIHLFDVFHSLPPEVATNKLQPKIYNDIHVCHIDESCLMEQEADQEHDQDTHPLSSMHQAEQIAARYNYQFHGIRLEDIYDPEWTDSSCFQAAATLLTSLPKDQLAISGQAPELISRLLPLYSTDNSATSLETDDQPHLSRQEKIAKLKALLAACTTLTAKETLLQSFRSSLLVQQAKRSQCGILALGDSATRVAVQIIGLTAIGRGYSLPHETSLESNWIPGLKVIRPMKDCLLKELEIHARLSDLELIEQHNASLDWTMRTKGEIKSIDRLTREFISGLDRDFPSTVATVCRTAAKLTFPEAATYEGKCPLCLGPAQKDVQEWKNRITVTTAPPMSYGSEAAVEPSQENSNGCCSVGEDGSSGCCSSNQKDSSCSSGTLAQTFEEKTLPFSSLLCYGCLTNLRDLDLKTMRSRQGQEEETSAVVAAAAATFELPPFVAETILDRVGFKSLQQWEMAVDQKNNGSSAKTPDSQESLREQIQEFLIASDDEEDE